MVSGIMKGTIIAMTVAVLLGGITSHKAQAEVSTSGNLTYVTKYIWRGFDLAPTEEPAVQGGISIDTGKGIALDVWGSYAQDSDSQLDELDYTLSWSGQVTESLEMSVGYTLYTFPSIVSAAESQEETREAFIGFAFPEAFMSPSLTIYNDWEAGDGTYIYLGGGYDFVISGESAPALSLSLGIGYNDDQWITESGISDIDLGLSMTFEAGSMEITPSINYIITPEDAVNPDNEFWAGLDFGFSL